MRGECRQKQRPSSFSIDQIVEKMQRSFEATAK